MEMLAGKVEEKRQSALVNIYSPLNAEDEEGKDAVSSSLF